MSKVRKLNEVLDGDSLAWRGEKISTEALLGKEIIIEKVEFAIGIGNTQYARVLADCGGSRIIFTTSAKLVLEILEKVQDKLPVSCTLKRPEGKRWLILE